MKAHEARMITAAERTGKLQEVYEAIETAAKKATSIHTFTSSSIPMIRRLEDNGYKITDLSDRNEICVNINWK